MEVNRGAADVDVVNKATNRLLNRMGSTRAQPTDIKVWQDRGAVNFKVWNQQ